MKIESVRKQFMERVLILTSLSMSLVWLLGLPKKYYLTILGAYFAIPEVVYKYVLSCQIKNDFYALLFANVLYWSVFIYVSLSEKSEYMRIFFVFSVINCMVGVLCCIGAVY
jgi:hypothetical protein